ncbi:MAG: cell wall hydrolase [Clostridiales bacterium]|nr:cell wall hydrolase [Clostridiales bacterium]
MDKKYITAVAAFIFLICSLTEATNARANEVLKNSHTVSYDSSVNSEENYILTDEEIRLAALVTAAEAEGECEEGKRLVIDVILNRMDSEHFPDSVSEVIFQQNQFPFMTNGRAAKCTAENYICNLVKEELKCRTNYDVIFFQAGGYSYYGYPLMKVGNHYFSSYDKTW